MSFDSSAFLKLYVDEAGTAQMIHLIESADESAISVLVFPEIVSGLSRKVREGTLLSAQYRDTKRRLADDVRDATIVHISPSVISKSVALLENNVLRASDAIHVASALECDADLFVSSDRRQIAAAANAGLPTRFIAPDGSEPNCWPSQRVR
ncbi:MAG: type II toxin-antitoxin system VapC family toxin [Candidatus Hydrogenedentota bacterium]